MSLVNAMFSPKLGIGLIKHQIQKQLKREIIHFDMSYLKSDGMINFLIPNDKGINEKYQLKSEENKIGYLIEQQIKQHVKKNVEIDAFIISYKTEKISIKVYYQTPEKNKEFIEIKL